MKSMLPALTDFFKDLFCLCLDPTFVLLCLIFMYTREVFVYRKLN